MEGKVFVFWVRGEDQVFELGFLKVITGKHDKMTSLTHLYDGKVNT